MTNLVEVQHPYEIKSIKSIKEYLFILKNLLRLIQNKGYKEKISGSVYPVRWSSKKSNFVVDMGSTKSRDVHGIDLDSCSLYYNEKHELYHGIKLILNQIKNSKAFLDIAKLYNMLKNENRFLVFKIKNNTVYSIGLFQRCQYKNRSGVYNSKRKRAEIIDITNNFNRKIASSLKLCDYSKIEKLNFNYYKFYTEFKAIFNHYSFTLLINNNNKHFYLKDLIDLEVNVNYKKLYIKDYINWKEKSVHNFNKNNLFWFVVYKLTELFGLFLIKKLNLKEPTSIIVYDINNYLIYKIINKFKSDTTQNNDIVKLLPPILPKRF